MGQNSQIEWTHHTFNPWRGCTKVSAGCAHCYAEKLSHRNPGALGVWGPDGQRVVAAESYWRQPVAWDRAAKAVGERHRVFCASLADVFEGPESMPAASVPIIRTARLRLLDLIRTTPNLDWLLLTKRPQNVSLQIVGATGRYAHAWLADCKNVWIGTSVEDQQTFDAQVPELVKIPAAIRFLSMEPLLGAVNIGSQLYRPGTGDAGPQLSTVGRELVDWIIVGGESGPHARPMHPDWVQTIRDDCRRFGPAFFFKQWGEFIPADSIVGVQDKPGILVPGRSECGYYCDETVGHVDHREASMVRVGKKAAGRLLDGREWNEFPISSSSAGAGGNS